ncbi:MAG TPA: hypothetical protein VEH30_08235 [Terriglobales bacterium]|nr:hypothetical protein [Terriglobales bacterium]
MINRDQNRQFRDAVREIERRLSRQLTDDERDRLHREITGMHFAFDTIVELGVGMFG